MAYQLNDQDLAALRAFAKAHGRFWKSQLSDVYWYNARLWLGPDGNDANTGSILHGLRNTLGPSWLAGFKLPKE